MNAAVAPDEDQILLGECLELLPGLPSGFFSLIYLDPPFNTGRRQVRRTLRAVGGSRGRPEGVRRADLSHRAAVALELSRPVRRLPRRSSRPRLEEARRLLTPKGRSTSTSTTARRTTASCCSTRSSAAECFLNEIIWAYDYGARAKRRWPAKHDTILVYVKDPARLPLRLRGGRPRALHGPGARDSREGRPGQAPDRRLVAHDRPDQRAREDRLSDPEAGGHPAPHRPGLDPAGRLVPGLLRRQRHPRSGRCAARSALHADRLQPGCGRIMRAVSATAGDPRARAGRLGTRRLSTSPGARRHRADVRAFGRCTTWSCASFLTTSAASTSPTRELCGDRRAVGREQPSTSANASGAPTRRNSPILEGPELELQELSLGRGWRAAERRARTSPTACSAAARSAPAAASRRPGCAPAAVPAAAPDPRLADPLASPRSRSAGAAAVPGGLRVCSSAWRAAAAARPCSAPSQRSGAWPKTRPPPDPPSRAARTRTPPGRLTADGTLRLRPWWA